MPAAGADSPRDAARRAGGELFEVLAIHGQPGAGADWDGLAKALGVSYRVIAPDRLGWGANERPAAGLRDNAEALVELLDNQGVADPVVVVGHSLGGGIALELALRHPGRVGALVLVASVGVRAALSSLDRLLGAPLLGESIVRAGVAALLGGLRTAERLADTGIVPAGLIKMEALPTVRAALGGAGASGVGRSRRSFVIEQRALLQETAWIEAHLGEIQVPTAVMAGAADRFIPQGAARELASKIPGAQLLVVPGGHLLPFDDPELIAGVVRRYTRLAAFAPEPGSWARPALDEPTRDLRDEPPRPGTPGV